MKSKAIFFIAFVVLSHLFTQAQKNKMGQVVDSIQGNPIPNATITIGEKYHLLSDANGYFRIPSLPDKEYEVTVTSIGFRDFYQKVLNSEFNWKIRLTPVQNLMAPIEIRAVRAAEESPFTKTLVSSKEIEKSNLGQDLPFLLDQTPSVVVNSDAGNGIGYTGIRIRGTDATRINITLNGIPYNDAESQGSFFVDLPDIASSAGSIQIQRGVGTSSNGAGAFGATINLATNEIHQNAYGEINNSFGSFNSWKNTLKMGTGLIGNHFTLDARLSRITSNGYIDRASSNLKSYFVSGAWLSNKTSIRFNVLSGKEKTYQAWYGVPESKLESDRSFNLAGTEKPGDPYDNETDNYQQDHYQAFLNQKLNLNWDLSLALFYTRGRGYYEQYKADQSYADYGLADPVINGEPVTSTDLVRQLWLDNHFYGNTFSFQYRKSRNELIFGGGWNRYDGNHFGKVIWAETMIPKDYTWYRLKALKTDFNVYGKWQFAISEYWDLFTDLQYRKVSYDIHGFRDNPALEISNQWNFFNPKIGLVYKLAGGNIYFSYAMANKEPNRDDFEAGETQQPKPEKLHDFELGFEKRTYPLSWGVTLFYMRYRDQLVLTGEINDVGAYTRSNIPNSYRAGIELQGSWHPAEWVQIAGNFTVSQNKVLDFVEYIDDYDNGGQKSVAYDKTNISYSPALTGGANLSFYPFKNFSASWFGKYVSRQYLDNTSKENRSLDPYFVQDLSFNYGIHTRFINDISLQFRLNNLLNIHYEPNGYTYSYIYGGSLVTENYYYPMAGTNFWLGLNIRL